MKNIKLSSILFSMVVATVAGCSKSNPACDGSTPTYNSEISSILTSNCASGGCHSSYSSYSGLSGILNNGQFERVVLTNRSMPQGGKLTNAELNSIQCWVDNGFPEK